MNQQAASVDHLSRRVVRDIEEDLRNALAVAHLDSDLVSALYLDAREVLGHSDDVVDVAVVDELALTLYLTASAWLGRQETSVCLLAALHQTLCKTLATGKEPSWK